MSATDVSQSEQKEDMASNGLQKYIAQVRSAINDLCEEVIGCDKVSTSTNIEEMVEASVVEFVRVSRLPLVAGLEWLDRQVSEIDETPLKSIFYTRKYFLRTVRGKITNSVSIRLRHQPCCPTIYHVCPTGESTFAPQVVIERLQRYIGDISDVVEEEYSCAKINGEWPSVEYLEAQLLPAYFNLSNEEFIVNYWSPALIGGGYVENTLCGRYHTRNYTLGSAIQLILVAGILKQSKNNEKNN